MSNSFRDTLRHFIDGVLSLPGRLVSALRTGWVDALRNPRIAVVAVILAVAATALMSIVAYRAALAIADGQRFEGDKAPGSHEWRKLNRDNIVQDFCARCHAGIVREFDATIAAASHPFLTCMDCHGGRRFGQGHEAVPRKCADCHPGPAAELQVDAHASFMRDLEDVGEDAARPSWSCKACHTKIEIDIEVIKISPLKLRLGP